jgi:hypothetical protein
VDRPSPARRRFHTDRIVANRRARFLREQDRSVYVGPLEHHNNTLSPIVDELLQYGRFGVRAERGCRRRDSNPRHADYDSAAPWLYSAV